MGERGKKDREKMINFKLFDVDPRLPEVKNKPIHLGSSLDTSPDSGKLLPNDSGRNFRGLRCSLYGDLGRH